MIASPRPLFSVPNFERASRLGRSPGLQPYRFLLVDLRFPRLLDELDWEVHEAAVLLRRALDRAELREARGVVLPQRKINQICVMILAKCGSFPAV